MAEPGTLFLVAGALAGAAAIALSILSVRRPAFGRAATGLLHVHAAATGLAAATMALYFLASRVDVRYVWEHTRVEYAWPYKLSGLWASQEGSLLLWLALATGIVAVHAARREATPLRLLAQAIALLFTTALAWHLVRIETFAPTDPNLIAFGTASGRGLAEVLVTPFMVVHPPVQFVAYAILTLPAAYALAGGFLRDPAWIAPAYRVARVGWAFATLGLGLGGLWAYYVLSFSGYWAWDPVETANLLPWLALTAFLHAGKYRERFGDFPTASLVLAFTAWALVILATFATRSGLWVSVHAFTDPSTAFEPDPSARLLTLLEGQPTTRFFLAILLASALAGLAGLAAWLGGNRPGIRRYAGVTLGVAAVGAVFPAAALETLFRAADTFAGGRTGLGIAAIGGLVALPVFAMEITREDPRTRGGILAPRRLMALGVAIFALALVVTGLLHVQAVNGGERARFDLRAPFVAIPLLTTLTLALALAPLGKRRAVALAGLGVFAGGVAVALDPERWAIAATVPVLLATAFAALVKIVHVNRGDASLARRTEGTVILVLSLALLVASSNPPSSLGNPLLLASVGLALGLAGLLAAVAHLRGSREWRVLRPRVRETGIYVVHLGVALGLVGVAFTTPTFQPDLHVEVAQLRPEEHVSVGSRDFYLTPFRASNGTSGLPGYDSAESALVMNRLGSAPVEVPVAFDWREPPISHYDPRLAVLRLATEDVYVVPHALCVAEPCSQAANWVRAHGDDTRIQSEVRAVAVEITILPLVTLVWAGLSVMLSGIALVIFGARERETFSEPLASRSS